MSAAALRRASGEPVSGDYAGRGDVACAGGAITQATVDVSGEPRADLETEAIAMFARD